MFRTLLLITLLSACAHVAHAQMVGADNRTPTVRGLGGRHAPRGRSPEEELLHLAEVRRGEAAHREMVEQAQEGAQLVQQLKADFERSRALGVEELKKLERVEKLAKKIRGGAGGSDDDEPLQNVPQEAGAALGMLVEAAEDLQKRVQKTSRLVTSAAVVRRSNEVIELSKYIRKFFR